ncbi:MAG: hypothetical protein IPG09_14620 [Ignavibacteria bacterium]|nr:hypothetical protein [Ignavibacteria bacterium]
MNSPWAAADPYSNHNGGILFFDLTDSFIAEWVTAEAAAIRNRAQKHKMKCSKVHRVDVINFRRKQYGIPPTNPFAERAKTWEIHLRYEKSLRMSQDAATGLIYCGDVVTEPEEINILEVGKITDGDKHEGVHTYNTSGCGVITNYTFLDKGIFLFKPEL